MNYYLSNTGNDANDGTSEALAWATLARLQTFLSGSPGLEPGDRVYFQKDGIWYETLLIPTQNDGAEGNTVQISPYGTGDAPTISGLKNLTGWTNTSGNLWTKTDATLPDYISLLLLDGIIRPKNISTPLKTTSDGTTTTLVSTNLPDFNYSGGEVELVVEKNDFIHDKAYISGIAGNTLTFVASSSYSTKSQKNYLIQNCLEALTTQGDWMYSPGTNTVTLYSEVNPSTLSIQVSSEEYNINGEANGRNELDELLFEGANLEGLRMVSSHNNVFDGLTFRNQGATGLGLWTSTDVIVRNCTFEKILDIAINQKNASNSLIVEDSTFMDIAHFFGACTNSDGKGFAIFGSSHNSIFRRNTFQNVGYIPIRFYGDNAEVYQNVIEGFCTIKHDGGAIYCYGGVKDSSTFVNRKIHNNIVSNLGVNKLHGIHSFYVDDNSEDIETTYNAFIHNGRSGYFNHNSSNILFNYNIIYSALYGSLYGHNAGKELIRNNEEKYNTKVLTGKGQHAYFLNSGLNDLALFGDIDFNTIILCAGGEMVVPTEVYISGQRVYNNLTKAQWQALSYDLNSTFLSLDIPEFTIATELANRFANSTFEANVDGVGIYHAGGTAVTALDSSSKITGTGSLKASVTAESTATTRVELGFANMGAIDPAKVYVLRFKALAPSGHQSLNIYLREKDTPYSMISTEIHTVATATVQAFEFFLYDLKEADTSSLMIDFQSHQGDLYVDDFEFKEVTGVLTDYEDHIKVFTNPTTAPATTALVGTWKTPADVYPGGNLTLQPFSSAVLIKEGDGPNPNTFDATLLIQGQGTAVNLTGPGPFSEGTVVNLLATPLSGYSFVEWKRGTETYNTSANINVVMTEDIELVAVFSLVIEMNITVRFLIPSDYHPYIRKEIKEDILLKQTDVIQKVEFAAEAEIASYLSSRFDVAKIFTPISDYESTRLVKAGAFIHESDKIWRSLVDQTGIRPSESATSDTPTFVVDDPRNPIIVLRMVYITLYHAHKALPGSQIPKLRIDDYDISIRWLEKVAGGLLNPLLPVAEEGDNYLVAFGSEERRVVRY